MKKILICSDSFKGTLSSKEISSIANSLVNDKYKKHIDLSSLLIADGGEGSLEAFKSIVNGKYEFIETIDAENNKIIAPYLLFDNDKAIIEVSKVIGLPLIKNSIEKTKRTTKGLGILIKDAIKKGAKTIYICLGGSSTNDFGIGMVEELGFKVNNKTNLVANDLQSINDFDDSKLIKLIKDVKFIGLSDVTNPLIGKNGATYVFGPQKGYNFEELSQLEKGMCHINSLLKLKKHTDLSTISGSGAAGGIGGCIYSLLNGKLQSGIDTLLELANFKEIIKDKDYIITGEGSFDNQSLNGKVISGILKYVDKNKLAIICRKSKIADKSYRILETSNGISDFNYIKANAKEMYKNTLDEFFKSIIE